MPVESDDMPEPTTALDTTMPDGTTPDAEAPRKSYAEMLLKPDCFPHEHDERQPAAADGNLDSIRPHFLP